MNGSPTPNETRRPTQLGPQPRRVWRFRKTLLIVPLACMFAAWFLHHIVPPTFDWEDVMDSLGVTPGARLRYSSLAVLALSLIAIVAVLRLLRRRQEDQGG